MTDGDLTGTVVAITGASSGIGASAARALAERGATVLPVGRSPERTRRVATAIGAEPLIADFARLTEVRQLAKVLARHRIDVLVNNAGAVVPTRQVTGDGHELTFQANHLAPFLLTNLLLPTLREAATRRPVRIVTTASLGHRFGRVRLEDLEREHRRYGNGWLAYCDTKLMNILFTRELARRTAGTGITAVSFNPDPGTEKTGTGDPTGFATETLLGRLLSRTPLHRIWLTGDDGAKPLVRLATAPEVADFTGSYFDGPRPDKGVSPRAFDADLADRLWQLSTELLGEHLTPITR